MRSGKKSEPHRKQVVIRYYYGLRYVLLQSAGAPGGLVASPRAHEDQFRGFKSHRVRTRIMYGLFLAK